MLDLVPVNSCEELVVLDLLDSPSSKPILVIVVEQALDEVLCFRGHHSFFMADRRPLNFHIQNILDNFFDGYSSEGPFPDQHFIDNNAEAPPINSLVFSRFPLNDLRGDIIWSAN